MADDALEAHAAVHRLVDGPAFALQGPPQLAKRDRVDPTDGPGEIALSCALRAESLAKMASQLCLARLPSGKSLRTLHAHTSDQGSIKANPLPATHGIRRGWPRIFSINPRFR